MSIKDRFWDHFPKSVTLSVADYMLKRDRVTQLQFGVCALLLDVETYLNKGDASFYHNNFGKELFGEVYDRKSSDKRFKDVIDSVMENGYDMSSCVLTNKHIELGNGTHRTAILLYLRQFQVKAKVFHHSDRNHFGFAKEQLERLKAPKEYADEVWAKFDDVQEMLIDCGASYNVFSEKEIDFESMGGCLLKRTHWVKPSENPCQPLGNATLDKGGWLYQLTLENPEYYCRKKQVLSKKMEGIGSRLDSIGCRYFVTRNCSEGKELYDNLKVFFE